MILKNRIEEIIKKIEELHPEDDFVFNKYFNKIFELLKDNENNTICVLNSLHAKDIDWLTPMFKDLSTYFQSHKFINCLEKIQNKYPSIHLIDKSIQWAKDAMNE